MKWFSLGLTVALGFGTAASAQSIQVTPDYQGYYTDNTLLTFVPSPTPVYGATFVHHIDVLISLSGLNADEDFQSVGFGVNNNAGLNPLDPKWNPAAGSYDSNGAAGGGVLNHWQGMNADIGINNNDLLDILVEATSSEARNRQYGEAARPTAGFPDTLGYPTLIGYYLLNWDGSNATTSIVPVTGITWGYYDNNSTGTGSAVGMTIAFNGGSFEFVPEPGILGLASLASLAFLRRIAR